MSDTNTFELVTPPTADLLARTAESRETSVDRFLREMLVLYTAVELQQATADLQRVLEQDTSAESAGTLPESEPPPCPYCRCSGTVNMRGSLEGFHIYCCSSVYCPLDTFAETESDIQDGDARMIAEIIDSPE